MPKSTLRRPTAISIGIERGKLEIKQFMRQRESVVFTMLFPLILLAIFGSVFSESIAEGVTFSQYFVAGMIASGLVNTGFQQLAIMIQQESFSSVLNFQQLHRSGSYWQLYWF